LLLVHRVPRDEEEEHLLHAGVLRCIRLYVHRTPEQKDPLLKRLRRIEGQVRGLQPMIEEDRYCLDEVQQANAITAAVRELAMLIMQDHLTAAVEHAVNVRDGNAAIKDMMAVLRAAM
jgi:CsoR family transcriptional regulator, copper-sensing transcriptional repressor